VGRRTRNFHRYYVFNWRPRFFNSPPWQPPPLPRPFDSLQFSSTFIGDLFLLQYVALVPLSDFLRVSYPFGLSPTQIRSSGFFIHLSFISFFFWIKTILCRFLQPVWFFWHTFSPCVSNEKMPLLLWWLFSFLIPWCFLEMCVPMIFPFLMGLRIQLPPTPSTFSLFTFLWPFFEWMRFSSFLSSYGFARYGLSYTPRTSGFFPFGGFFFSDSAPWAFFCHPPFFFSSPRRIRISSFLLVDGGNPALRLVGPPRLSGRSDSQ